MVGTKFLVIASTVVEGRLRQFYWDGDQFIGCSEQYAMENCAILGRDIALLSLQVARLVPGLAAMDVTIQAYEIVANIALVPVQDERRTW